MRNGVLISIGAATFSALQIIWSSGHALGLWGSAWIMKSGSGIGVCFAAFLVVGAVVVAYRHSATDLLRRARSVILGAVVAMIVALLIIGPGTLWPIVIASNGAIIGGAALVGGVIGNMLGGRRTHV
jgi:hypothetical protein